MWPSLSQSDLAFEIEAKTRVNLVVLGVTKTLNF